MGTDRVTVNDLRNSLGDQANDRMIALQLQELESVEHVKDEFLPKIERIVEQMNEEAADYKERRDAAGMGLEVIADYVKYNQRWNDTLKTLMAILKQRSKTAAAGEAASPFDALQRDLVGVEYAKQAKTQKKTRPA